jgi:hypothetical protein
MKWAVIFNSVEAYISALQKPRLALQNIVYCVEDGFSGSL